jgi:hypothetical protein
MARGRSRKAPAALAPSLELIVKALEDHYQEHGLRRGESDALRALGELAGGYDHRQPRLICQVFSTAGLNLTIRMRELFAIQTRLHARWRCGTLQ